MSPTLIMTSNLPLNLMKHLSKNYKDEFDNNSNVFSQEMISAFERSMENIGYEIISNIPLLSLSSDLPDIDICLIDRERHQVMLCEFKWTIPPADPSEVRDKASLEKHALSQLERLKSFFNEYPNELADILKIEKINDIYFIGIFENHVGTDLMFNEELPIADYRVFCRMLNEKENLGGVFQALSRRDYLPRENIDFQSTNEENIIGSYKIIWTGYIG